MNDSYAVPDSLAVVDRARRLLVCGATLLILVAGWGAPPAAMAQTACGNGDFESDLDAAEWAGGRGSVPDSGDPDFASFVAGLQGGPLSSASSRQTLVTAGTDTTVGINQVAPVGLDGTPGGSTRAVRIGNAVDNFGSELLSKTFTVTAAESVIRFWYAAVFEDPGHPPHQQPSFWVRVVDSTGAVLPGVVDLGNNSDKLVSDGTNPFFVLHQGGVLYRDWSCAQIDLSGHVGETVTVQFVTEDCAQGAHFGYAYVDNFCGSCQGDPSGTIEVNPSASTSCGPGQVCFDFTLPAAGSTTGTAVITLDIRQNGGLAQALTSPLLTEGNRHCFALDPASIPGLLGNLGSFDIVATAQFAIDNTPLAPKSAGAAPDGIRAGLNNDYKINCPEDIDVSLGTGFDEATGTLLPRGTADDDWTVQLGNQPPQPARVVTRPRSAWRRFRLSEWISHTAAGASPAGGSAHYERCFCIASDATDAKLTLRLWADDVATVRLNGTLIGAGGQFRRSKPLSAVYMGAVGSSLFQAGDNCVSVDVADLRPGAAGLDISGSVWIDHGRCAGASY